MQVQILSGARTIMGGTMATRRRRKNLTDVEFMLAVDNAGGLLEATINGDFTADDLESQSGELYNAMRAWDRHISRMHALELRVINAILD
jgi:hypothetical protein